MLYFWSPPLPNFGLVFVEAQTQPPQDGAKRLTQRAHLEVIKDTRKGGGTQRGQRPGWRAGVGEGRGWRRVGGRR